MENILIEELELGVRSYNCLKRVGIETIGDLVVEDRAGARGDPELRQEVDRRGQGDARDARPLPARRRAVSAPAQGPPARPRRGAPQGAVREPDGRARHARPHQDHAREGEGGAARGGEDDHARQARRPARPPAGRRVPALEDRRAPPLRGGRAALRGAAKAATRGSSSSARARATRRRWPTSSSSTRPSG